MYKTYLIGTGYLSSKLSKKIKKSKIYSSEKFISQITNVNKSKEKFNIIVNAFYSARKLNTLNNYKYFVEKSLLNLSEILDKINPKNINKILYTSSSSFYGSLGGKIGVSDKNNRYIYSSLKISAENLIKNYCNKNKILFDICRVFNLYGPKDGFSIISKLKDLPKNNSKLQIYNNGESIRDFIHVDDIVNIYKQLLKRSDTNIYDIGTGNGTKLKDIINSLELNTKKITYIKTKNYEIDKSIADNRNLINQLKYNNFKKLQNFIKGKKLPGFKKKNKINLLESALYGSIIYGAGFSGRELYKQMSNYDQNSISYFVDDDPKKIGSLIDDIKILSFNQLNELSQEFRIRNIIVAIPSLKNKNRSVLFKKLLPLTSSISTLPEKKFYKKKSVNISDIDEISLEDILHKNDENLKKKSLNNFTGKTILVTGGAGSIGTEISKQLLRSKLKKLIILDHSELNIYRISQKLVSNKTEIILGNIQDQNLIEKIIEDNNVNYIFHAAAYKHVKFLEKNIYSAIQNNIIGTFSLLKSIKNKKIHFVFISTDKAVKPKTILGMTKRIGEILVNFVSENKAYNKSKFTIVRFGNVIGSDGSALPYFYNQIRNDSPILLTDKKMSRYFMTIREACELVLQSININGKKKLLFLDMGKPLMIYDIIKKIFNLYKVPNQKLKIKIIGNRFNEKISERLFYSNNFNKTKIKKIYSTSDKTPNIKQTEDFLNFLNSKIIKFNKKQMLEMMKKFINKK